MQKIILYGCLLLMQFFLLSSNAEAWWHKQSTTKMEVKLTIFNDLGQSKGKILGKKISINHQNPSENNSIEFRQYKNMLQPYLENQGFTVVDERVYADYDLYMSYSIKTEIHTRSVPTYGQTSGGGYSTYTGSVIGGGMYSGSIYTQPQYGITGYRTVQEEYYTRQLNVSIRDRNLEIYNAVSISSGNTNSLPTVMRGLIIPIFDNFPGPKTITRELSVPMELYNPEEYMMHKKEEELAAAKAEERKEKRKERKKRKKKRDKRN